MYVYQHTIAARLTLLLLLLLSLSQARSSCLSRKEGKKDGRKGISDVVSATVYVIYQHTIAARLAYCLLSLLSLKLQRSSSRGRKGKRMEGKG
jgi:hypothetical protein